jgi:O-antigen/teichoic acid export membrane protein
MQGAAIVASGSPRAPWRSAWHVPQHQNAAYLVASNLLGAAAGLAFWLVIARASSLDATAVGVGYAAVALGSAVAVVAKGGLDSALLRTVPVAGKADGPRLLRFAIAIGASIALLGVFTVGSIASLTSELPQFRLLEWALVALIAALLVSAWLQDAYLLAVADAAFVLRRNLVFAAARLVLPLPLIALAFPNPVALAWCLALAVSVGSVLAMRAGRFAAAGSYVHRRRFLARAARNVTGGAAEFLPGLLLAPIVLALDGPESAAYFGIAWAVGSMLFVLSASVSRSALTQLSGIGGVDESVAVRRGIVGNLWIVLPAAVILAASAPIVLSFFGPAYVANGTLAVILLSASALFVAPSYLYFALLRARDRSMPLIVFPLAMVAALAITVPLLANGDGPTGFALAWLVANVPLGLYAAQKLRQTAREVTRARPAPDVDHRAYLE